MHHGGRVDFGGGSGFGHGEPVVTSFAATSSGRASFPSRAPEYLAYGALVASLSLTSQLRGIVPLSAVTPAFALRAAALGYLLAPFVVVGALVWARADGVRRQSDPWFDTLGLARQLRRLQIASLVSFAIAFDHVTTIATWATARFG